MTKRPLLRQSAHAFLEREAQLYMHFVYVKWRRKQGGEGVDSGGYILLICCIKKDGIDLV